MTEINPNKKQFNSQLNAAAPTGGITVEIARSSPAYTDPQNVYSGTYTPSISNPTNMTAINPSLAQFIRVGNVVTVSGRIDYNVTAAGGTSTGVNISLPVAMGSNFASGALGCSGVISAANGTNVGVIAPQANAKLAAITFAATASGNNSNWYTFTYQIQP